MKHLTYPTTVAVLCLLLSVTGCIWETGYSGDGELVDSGATSATDRYILDLGRIDLGKEISYTYQMKNLPQEEFVIGFNLVFDKPIDIANKPKISNIMLSLVEENRHEITFESAPLNIRVWSQLLDEENRAFVYNREKRFFIPQKGAHYTLTVRIDPTGASTLRPIANLLLKSGGWK